jgi:glycogen debranching enzyme
MKPQQKDARMLAQSELKACMTESGFTAGNHHFVDLWARDSLFATLGANASRMTDASRKTIETFLSYQRADGLIPYLILRSRHTIGKYFNRHSYYEKPVAHFRSHMSFGTVPDGGLMTVIAAADYARVTRDYRFLTKHYNKLARALSWYETRFRGGLIREWFQCEWADALLKSGSTLYTNVLYYKALADMTWIAGKRKNRSDQQRFLHQSETLRKRINDELWTSSYFADWKDWKRQDYFAVHPNMLAILFNVTTSAQAKRILLYAATHTGNGWTMNNSHPKYPWWRVPLLHHVIGMGDYHNGLIWLQPGMLYAGALYKEGYRAKAKMTLDKIARKIIESGGAHEVYETNGTPVNRLVYRSEHPFAWSAGLFIWISSILRK